MDLWHHLTLFLEGGISIYRSLSLHVRLFGHVCVCPGINKYREGFLRVTYTNNPLYSRTIAHHKTHINGQKSLSADKKRYVTVCEMKVRRLFSFCNIYQRWVDTGSFGSGQGAVARALFICVGLL